MQSGFLTLARRESPPNVRICVILSSCRHFINNLVPLSLMAMLSNMGFKATLTKDDVIEYMTKYMTKYEHGPLIKVMEHSFSLCIVKAREQVQGAGTPLGGPRSGARSGPVVTICCTIGGSMMRHVWQKGRGHEPTQANPAVA